MSIWQVCSINSAARLISQLTCILLGGAGGTVKAISSSIGLLPLCSICIGAWQALVCKQICSAIAQGLICIRCHE